MEKRFAGVLCLVIVFLCVSLLTACLAGQPEGKPEETGVSATELSAQQEEATVPVTETTTPATEAATTEDEWTQVAHVGQVPEALRGIVETNAFYGFSAFGDRLLRAQEVSRDAESRTVTYQVRMIDLYATELAVYTCSVETSYHIRALTTTSDGGFLFVLGFANYYITEENRWASEKGFASRVIKCDENGNVQFDTAFDGVSGSALQYCLEADGRYYFFGTAETPETKTTGVYSPTDVCLTVLDENGRFLQSACIAGSDYDSLWAVKKADNGFALYIYAQSDDGDFEGSNSNGYGVGWIFTVNEALEITERHIAADSEEFRDPIGQVNGKPVYRNAEMLKDFDAGSLSAVIDYGDFYLIVSSNITGIYENTPVYASSWWDYTETVYSGYDYQGNLLFRTSVDSTPDYEGSDGE